MRLHPVSRAAFNTNVARTKPPALLERDTSKQVRDFMIAKGWRVFRVQRVLIPGAFATGEKGMPDFTFVRYLKQGKYPALTCTLYVEMKREKGGVVGPHQVKWKKLEEERGGIVWTVDSFTLFVNRYDREFAWLHDGRLPGQVEFGF